MSQFSQFSRRTFLKLGFATVLFGFLGTLFYKVTGRYLRTPPLSETESGIITAYIDELIPRDEFPGAIDLNVHELVLEEINNSPYLKNQIRRGCKWLVNTSRTELGEDFLNLTNKQRQEIIAISAETNESEIFSQFYLELRNRSFQHYYSNPETWVQLNYPGPPQPNGFMDYQYPPALKNT